MAVPQLVVYYRAEDYLGVMRRLLIDFVDAGFAAGVSWMLTFVLAAISPSVEMSALLQLIVWTTVWTLYFVVLKGSRFRTLGYVLAGARIVNFQGERPGRLALFVRLAFVVFGPTNFMLDLFWVPSDPRGQALRDKFAHTFVVRKDAVPAGTGQIGYPTYMVFGWTLMFAEVRPGP
jgi:uncharacterized RDD family membrane protein YckC